MIFIEIDKKAGSGLLEAFNILKTTKVEKITIEEHMDNKTSKELFQLDMQFGDILEMSGCTITRLTGTKMNGFLPTPNRWVITICI